MDKGPGVLLNFCVIIFLYFHVHGSIADLRVRPTDGLYLLQGQTVNVTRKFKEEFTIYDENLDFSQGVMVEGCNTKIEEQPVFDVNVFQNFRVLGLSDISWNFSSLSSKLERIYMKNISVVGAFSECSQLKYLHMISPIDFTLTLSNWLENCTQLRTLELQMSIPEILIVLGNATMAKKLVLNTVHNISDILRMPLFSNNSERGQSIQKVSLQGLEFAKEENDLETWDAVSAALVWQLSHLQRLEELAVVDHRFNFCSQGSFQSTKFRSLKFLTLVNSNTLNMCFKNMRIAPKLTSLVVLSYIYDKLHVQFGELFSTSHPQLDAYFNSKPQGTTFIFTRDDYIALSDTSQGSRKSNVSLGPLTAEIECNCQNTIWFTRALRQQLVTAWMVTCENKSQPIDLQCEWLDCKRVRCNSPCLCCSDGQGGVIADCRYMDTRLREIPDEVLRISNLTHLLASDNDISSLPTWFPDTLLQMNLDGNNIWKAGIDGVKAIFSNPKRRLRLSGNTISCDCDKKLLLQTLQIHRDQVEDFDEMTCSLSNIKIGAVAVEDLCTESDRQKVLMTTMVVALVLAALILLTLVVYYRWRREIQLFLFAHGWCLFCIKEENLDEDRQYDVFLSFCHEDTEIVMNHLLPALDRDYSVCLHLRDWCPGEMIPTQIAESVRRSRRTIVVLSRSFIHSLWGLLEFQTAHVSALSEGRVRVVLIILDDVLEREKIPADLQAYIRLNTYMRWTDPWFWQKLRYALPHQPLLKKDDTSQDQEISTLRHDVVQLIRTE